MPDKLVVASACKSWPNRREPLVAAMTLAALGMPINVGNPKTVGSYNGPARTKPRSGTTLTPR